MLGGHGSDFEFHSQRSLAELDLARRATSAVAADAHLRLSQLHADKLSALLPTAMQNA